jgi:salicylate 5-hydroxylase small subunit
MDFTTYHAICTLQHQYAHILDSKDLSTWPDLFTADGVYQLQSRENFDAGLPLSIMHLTSQGMLRDRVYAVMHTIYHAPYYQRHVCGAPCITQAEGGGFLAESSYTVVRTQRDSMPQILSVGRYIDHIVQQDGAWKFKERKAVFDNDLIPNSIIKPV